MFTVKIARESKVPGKVAEAELHFTEGPLSGLKLIGFGVWERQGGGGHNVTFPARTYAVNGERRSFALLRPIAEAGAQDGVRDAIVQAYLDTVALEDEDSVDRAERALGVE